MSEAEFVEAVLTLYTDPPDTPLRPAATDQVTARRLFTNGVPLALVESAMLLGSMRRLHRDTTLPPLSKVRSLAYFLPVIEELLLQPLPETPRADAIDVAARKGVPAHSSTGSRSSTIVSVQWAGRPSDPEAEPNSEWVVYLFPSGQQ
jgi:hypothetical protein